MDRDWIGWNFQLSFAKFKVQDAFESKILAYLNNQQDTEMNNLFSIKRLVCSICVTLIVVNASIAQDTTTENTTKPLELPECDIFLFDLENTGESGSLMKLSNGRNITRRKGYDNQPWFTPESKSILFTANHAPDRTDVFEYFVESKETKPVTDSPTQEYSPQISPDNKTVSFVTDGKTANQSVWSVQRGEDSRADPNSEKWLLKNQGDREPVGYYSWNHKTGYILYWSRYGYAVRLVHESKELSHFVTGSAPPSSPYIIPGTGKFSFMHRQSNEEVWIKELDPETLAVRPLVKVVGSNPNYGWTPDGWIVMCDGTKLFRCLPTSKNPSENKWELVVDLKSHGMKSASRVALSPNGKMLAVVGLPTEE